MLIPHWRRNRRSFRVGPLWGGFADIAVGYLMHDTTPRVPAMAVSTVMSSLRISFQLMETHPIPPFREGAAKPPDLVFIFSIVGLVFRVGLVVVQLVVVKSKNVSARPAKPLHRGPTRDERRLRRLPFYRHQGVPFRAFVGVGLQVWGGSPYSSYSPVTLLKLASARSSLMSLASGRKFTLMPLIFDAGEKSFSFICSSE